MFSILILTLNEEGNLPRCLSSARACDDIVVLDSGSTDRTIAIAHAAGARVFSRAFDNFANQRNHAQRAIPFRHRWVFHLDADEQLTPDLFAECLLAAAHDDHDGYFVAPRIIFRGHWIPRCTDFPAYQARFVRAPEFSFIQAGHGQREAPHMKMGRLRENYLHHLTDGDATWLRKHQRYAEDEARAHQADDSTQLRDLRVSDPLHRRRALKRLSHRLPFRPQLRFIYQYILRGGFLEGTAGLNYCRLLVRYEQFVNAEARRLRRSTP